MRRLAAAGVGTLLGAVLLVAPAAAAPAPAVAEIRFESLNRAYHDLAEDLAPIRQGPMTLTLRSPRNNLVLRDHVLRLRPGREGSHRAELEVEIMGNADVAGELDVNGLASAVDDHLVVPPQTVRVPARIRLAPSLDGFEVTPLELPASVPVRVESRLGRKLVGVCEGFGLLVAALDCGALDRSLTTIAVPLPPAGETYLLPASEVSPEERTAILRYLEASESLGRTTADR